MLSDTVIVPSGPTDLYERSSSSTLSGNAAHLYSKSKGTADVLRIDLA